MNIRADMPIHQRARDSCPWPSMAFLTPFMPRRRPYRTAPGGRIRAKNPSPTCQASRSPGSPLMRPRKESPIISMLYASKARGGARHALRYAISRAKTLNENKDLRERENNRLLAYPARAYITLRPTKGAHKARKALPCPPPLPSLTLLKPSCNVHATSAPSICCAESSRHTTSRTLSRNVIGVSLIC